MTSAPSDFSWDAGDDFQLVWGPQKGSVSTYSNTNGHSSRSSQTTYTYILLPKAIGKFSLPAAHATVKGADIQSDPWGIEVVADSGRQSRQESQSGNSAAVTGSVSSDDIYLSFDLSKSDVVVGETVTATLKLYQRVNLVGFENVKFPTFNGFWSQETQAPTNLEFHRESVDGKIYNVALIRSWTLVPQQAGDIVIDPTEMVSVINIRVDRPSSGSIFDEFFQNDYQSIRKRLTTDPVTVHVHRLPDGAPSSFGGGVGKFSMTTALSRDELSVHDAEDDIRSAAFACYYKTGHAGLLPAHISLFYRSQKLVCKNLIRSQRQKIFPGVYCTIRIRKSHIDRERGQICQSLQILCCHSLFDPVGKGCHSLAVYREIIFIGLCPIRAL